MSIKKNKTIKDYQKELLELQVQNVELIEKTKTLETELTRSQITLREVDKLIEFIKVNYVHEGRWVSIKWWQVGKWINLGKEALLTVKNILAAWGITFKSRK